MSIRTSCWPSLPVRSRTCQAMTAATVNKGTLSGYPASRLSGSYTKNGVPRMVAQNTVVIQSKDGIYLLQLKAEGPEADADALRAAARVIVQKTTITP